MTVLLHPIPEKYLNRLNEPDKSRIKAALYNIGKEPQEGDIIPVTGQPGHFRVRAGSYRLLYRIKDDAIFVTHIDPRGQVYSKKNKGKKR